MSEIVLSGTVYRSSTHWIKLLSDEEELQSMKLPLSVIPIIFM